MFRDLKRTRWALVVVGLVATGLLVARNFVDPSPPAPGRDLPTVSAERAAEHVGETARICGPVVQARYVPSVEGRPTFLNLGAPHPGAVFTVVIWEEARARFEAAPEDLYGGRRICIRGNVESHEGTPQIQVSHPDQIETGTGSDSPQEGG